MAVDWESICIRAESILRVLDDVPGMRVADQDDYLFVFFNFYPVSRERAVAINPELRKFNSLGREEGAYYGCRMFDGRTCSAYSSRPSLCADFPWYGRQPNVWTAMYSKNCGYAIPFRGIRKKAEIAVAWARKVLPRREGSLNIVMELPT